MRHFNIEEISYIHQFQTNDAAWHTSAPRKYNYLAYQISGEYEHKIKSKTLVAKCDTLIFLNKFDAYDVNTVESGLSVCFAFEGATSMTSFTLDCSDSMYIKNLFIKMLAKKNIENEINYFLCMSAAYEIVAYIKKASEMMYQSRTTKDKLYKAHTYILEHYMDEDIDNESLSNICDLSKHRFITLFKEKYTTTPNQYIIQKRIDASIKFLNSQMYTISQIAEMVGFNDLYYFSKTFKKHMNMSPSGYKKALQLQQPIT